MEKRFPLLDPKIPLVFTDGTKIYEEIGKDFLLHKVGYFILAPSGAGKTHYVRNQKEQHWMDGDELWMATNAHPDEEWWLRDLPYINSIDQKCDVITAEAKKLGFWIVGASNYWLKPDAIVIPDWETHKGYIAHRETHNYDGGAKSDALEGVLNHRKIILEWEKQGVPKFESVEEAATYLQNL